MLTVKYPDTLSPIRRAELVYGPVARVHSAATAQSGKIMGLREKIQNAAETIQAKETSGEVTGAETLESEGKADSKKVGDDVEDAFPD